MAHYFAAGQNATAALLNNAPTILSARKTTALTRNNTTATVTDTELTVAVVASSVWAVMANLYYTAATAADAAFNLAVPAGATYQFSPWGVQVGATSTTDTINVGVSSSANLPVGGVGTGLPLLAALRATVVVGGSAGSVAIRFAQNTLSATDTVLHIGSWMLLVRLA